MQFKYDKIYDLTEWYIGYCSSRRQNFYARKIKNYGKFLWCVVIYINTFEFFSEFKELRNIIKLDKNKTLLENQKYVDKMLIKFNRLNGFI